MNDRTILNLPRLPARLDVQQTAQLLGFMPHDISVLVRARLLKPLGNPVANAPKWFASADVMERTNDPGWLDRATKSVSENWRKKNGRRKEAVLCSPDAK